MIDAMFQDVRSAVEEVLQLCKALCLALDGWTDDKGQTLVNACLVAFGLPFWSYQVTPKGERHTVKFYKDVMKAALVRKNLYGVVSDSPTGMVAFRNAVAADADGKLHPVACDFHVDDKSCGDVCGKGPLDAKAFIIPQLDTTSDTSLISLAKGFVKYFLNRGVPNGLVREIRAEMNKGRRLQKEPLISSLRLPGDTRATSIATCMVSVSDNKPVLRAVVLDERWDEYQTAMAEKVDRLKADSMAKFARSSETMDKIGTYGTFLSLFQQKQRVSELRDKALSDVVYDTGELLRRIDAFEGVDAAAKSKARAAVIYRFDHTFYTPSVALAWRLDPRGEFGKKLVMVVP
jgi:hypothetical protein